MAGAPRIDRGQRFRRPAFSRVQEVAEEYNSLRGRSRQRRVEPVECFAGRATRYEYARRAKRRRLAEMWIGDEEHACALPVRCTFAKQHESLAGDAGARVDRAHPAARSNASCILRTRSAS